MKIRDAGPGDSAEICEIWNPVIRDTDATFNTVEKTPQALRVEIGARQAGGHAFLVAEQGARLLGFATYGQFRASVGYRRTMEHTIIIANQARGRGVGQKLMQALEGHARAAGVHSMFAGVSHVNLRAIAFHAALGYQEVARLPEVGFKFNRWYDLVLMQKML